MHNITRDSIMMLLQVYKGYVDDPRNTDNAWMETVAVNFHDDTGEVFSEFKLQVSNLFRLFSSEVSRSVSVDIHVWLYSLWRKRLSHRLKKLWQNSISLLFFFGPQAGDDAAAVRWQRVSGNIPLFASHVSILEKVAKMRNAAF